MFVTEIRMVSLRVLNTETCKNVFEIRKNREIRKIRKNLGVKNIFFVLF